MAMCNPVSLMAQLWRLWASFPGIHIAQLGFALIYNYGVIPFAAMRRSKRCDIGRQAGLEKNYRSNCTLSASEFAQIGITRELRLSLPIGGAHNMTVPWHRRRRALRRSEGS
jgi:hypothetical protein